MGFLRRVHAVTLFDKVHRCEIRKALNFEPLLIRIERSQLCCFGHVSIKSHEMLQRQVMLVTSAGKRSIGRPRNSCSDQISDFTWSCLGVEPVELSKIGFNREVFRVLLCCPRDIPQRKTAMKMNKIF